MNIRIGTDIVHIPRIKLLLDRYGDRFLRKVYTAAEQQDYWQVCSTHLGNALGVVRLAGRWAAKEAVVKAIGTGWSGIGYTDVEIQRQRSGIPRVCIYRAAASHVAHWGEGDWQLSLSHDGDYAIATALFVGRTLAIQTASDAVL